MLVYDDVKLTAHKSEGACADLDGLFPERVESGDGFGPPPDTLPLCNGIEFVDRSVVVCFNSSGTR